MTESALMHNPEQGSYAMEQLQQAAQGDPANMQELMEALQEAADAMSDEQLADAMQAMQDAAEAMEGGGTLVITTCYLPREDRIKLVFTDTGVGIRKESMSDLFEPFYTTKKKGKGVGLGLSVAYGIIQEHKGSIFVDSEPGKGAAFTIKLPVNTGV